MKGELSNLFRLTKSHARAASEVLDLAFKDYPLHIAFIPNDSERKKKSRYLLEFFVRYGILYGEVYAISPKHEAVIMWLPSEKADFNTWRMIRSGLLLYLFRIGIKTILKMMPVGNYITSIHKRYAPFPHLYGWYVAVHPDFQGKGYGRTLMKAMLARADSEQLPLYSETQTEENVAMHVNYGFRVLHESIIPDNKVKHWAMLRDYQRR